VRYAISFPEKKLCVVPHSRHWKWSVSRRAHGFGESQTAQRVCCGAKGRSQWSQATASPAELQSSSQLTAPHNGHRQQTAIGYWT